MFPMIGLVQVGGQALADRYAYIAFIGLFVMAVWTVADWAGRRQIPSAWVAVAATVVLIALGVVTHRQIGFWRDTPTMWRRALEVTENNFVAHTNLATFLEQQGQVEEAADHLRAALAIQPDDLIATLSLGTYEHQRGNLPAAIERYKIVALHATDPDLRTTAYSNLGSAYRQVGDYADAKQCYDGCCRFRPGIRLPWSGWDSSRCMMAILARPSDNFRMPWQWNRPILGICCLPTRSKWLAIQRRHRPRANGLD